MKRLVSILFAFVITVEAILPEMDTSELSKLPVLINHYRQHHKTDPSLSFLSFIDQHYNNRDHYNKDQEHHHKLPFSNHQNHNCQLHQVVFMLPEIILSPDVCVKPVKNEPYYSPPEGNSIQRTIWQPPKLGQPFFI